jgi:hypothetical protein
MAGWSGWFAPFPSCVAALNTLKLSRSAQGICPKISFQVALPGSDEPRRSGLFIDVFLSCESCWESFKSNDLAGNWRAI